MTIISASINGLTIDSLFRPPVPLVIGVVVPIIIEYAQKKLKFVSTVTFKIFLSDRKRLLASLVLCLILFLFWRHWWNKNSEERKKRSLGLNFEQIWKIYSHRRRKKREAHQSFLFCSWTDETTNENYVKFDSPRNHVATNENKRYWPGQRWRKGDMIRSFCWTMFVDCPSIDSDRDELDLEEIFKSCRDSSIAWSITHAVYVCIISSTFINIIALFHQFVLIIRLEYYCYRNRHFDVHENVREISGSHAEFICRLFSRQIVSIFLYVFVAYICHSLWSDMPMTPMSITRWFIEAIVDTPFFLLLVSSFFGMLMDSPYDEDCLYGTTEQLFITKISQFCLLRYAEFHRQSKFNTFLTCVFRRFCLVSFDSHSSNHSIYTFLKELDHLMKDFQPLLQ